MNKLSLFIGCIALAASTFGVSPVQARTRAIITCMDGSLSKGGQGACSHHGGIDKSAKKERAPKRDEATFSRAEALWENEEGDLVTAKCKDGTFSRAKHHEGACSQHGGVAEFLKE